jgi:hypothetical protein
MRGRYCEQCSRAPPPRSARVRSVTSTGTLPSGFSASVLACFLLGDQPGHEFMSGTGLDQSDVRCKGADYGEK